MTRQNKPEELYKMNGTTLEEYDEALIVDRVRQIPIDRWKYKNKKQRLTEIVLERTGSVIDSIGTETYSARFLGFFGSRIVIQKVERQTRGYGLLSLRVEPGYLDSESYFLDIYSAFGKNLVHLKNGTPKFIFEYLHKSRCNKEDNEMNKEHEQEKSRRGKNIGKVLRRMK